MEPKWFHNGGDIMPSITVKGVPDALYTQLKQRAKKNRRSLNSEIIVCLEEAANRTEFDPEAWLKEVERLRNEVKVTPLTDEEIHEAKNWGRP